MLHSVSPRTLRAGTSDRDANPGLRLATSWAIFDLSLRERLAYLLCVWRIYNESCRSAYGPSPQGVYIGK
jgi:hypothetical protein